MGQVQKPTVVLVVEDEPLLLMDAVAILEDAGCTAIEANSAAKAIEILESGVEIDVVFTDIEMPGGMNGIRLAHAIRDRWPPVRLIITSGRVFVGADELPQDAVFFSKPYNERQLLSALG